MDWITSFADPGLFVFMQEELAAPIKNAPFSRENSVSFKIDPAIGGEDELNA